ncbi:MAG: hypothetical protein UT30_C0034G0002 [Candidatus Uhrbacteria bacterium GW2011_GWF2_39_13]|uniref:Uncharacterized protein n=1 Tax=Candidatus Uhrbacteria bacterium GW2011_GWF2_39_13 TaxID=1618995 RepID=A0A0G0QNH9_9BACT|nr:MAG: hypothetical protein UT30_C0034G0002 [Candidatus Uhrbacteria bacterium GW2011_GWF2_39_13]OGJ44547.1 MAG: hypothetical protein A2272_04600 [Candidatus Peregrinibacteria bacterium RIFOXYA12_FULL_33_12]OGJ45339.1 MAG: hypothetical protein A2263_06005 [Candidatus Peregrinibacteria bacterium RIFOXYA2_FULL_33_21]OGJ50953.1 MAG: hypothetical protein A2307_00955 [Candidatus Peregrinibacteria bacterium RIFOXYB2_FULL_33_20]
MSEIEKFCIQEREDDGSQVSHRPYDYIIGEENLRDVQLLKTVRDGWAKVSVGEGKVLYLSPEGISGRKLIVTPNEQHVVPYLLTSRDRVKRVFGDCPIELPLKEDLDFETIDELLSQLNEQKASVESDGEVDPDSIQRILTIADPIGITEILKTRNEELKKVGNQVGNIDFKNLNPDSLAILSTLINKKVIEYLVSLKFPIIKHKNAKQLIAELSKRVDDNQDLLNRKKVLSNYSTFFVPYPDGMGVDIEYDLVAQNNKFDGSLSGKGFHARKNTFENIINRAVTASVKTFFTGLPIVYQCTDFHEEGFSFELHFYNPFFVQGGFVN